MRKRDLKNIAYLQNQYDEVNTFLVSIEESTRGISRWYQILQIQEKNQQLAK